VLSGLAYCIGLSVFGSRVIFVRVLERELQPEDALVFHVGHAVYGVTLGTVVATSESAGDVSRESKQTRPDTAKQRRESEWGGHRRLHRHFISRYTIYGMGPPDTTLLTHWPQALSDTRSRGRSHR